MMRSMAALVIGNGNYPDDNDLANPVHDADDLSDRLEGYGFNLVKVTDCTAAEMDKALKKFRVLLETHDVALFFFAGHGMQIEGINYLLATDSDMASESDAKYSSLSLDKVIDVMDGSAAATKIIILDACRNNPWERRWHRGANVRGLASVYAPKGTIIGFATSPGQYADDGKGRNGTYTEALLQHIDSPDCSIETMFKRVRNTVAAATRGKQTSWEHTSLAGEFYFNMSLGTLIEEYDATALADRLFLLDEGKRSHRIITGLKSHDWYKQNPALDELNAARAAKASADSLFVLGRNIYQAACGGAHRAELFIDTFVQSTRGYAEDARKALLDGMLFEVFFDAEGTLRRSIKADHFNELFDLQRHASLKTSFDFIADAVVAAGGAFHVVPGKGHELALTVTTRKKRVGYFVEGIFIDGVDVLRADEDAWDSDDDEIFYSNITRDQLIERLSVDLAVPTRLLKVAYVPGAAASSDDLRVRMGWTAAK